VVVQQSRPSARTWVLAAIELIAAIAVARLIVASDNTSGAHHHTGPGRPSARRAQSGRRTRAVLLAAQEVAAFIGLLSAIPLLRRLN